MLNVIFLMKTLPVLFRFSCTSRVHSKEGKTFYNCQTLFEEFLITASENSPSKQEMRAERIAGRSGFCLVSASGNWKNNQHGFALCEKDSLPEKIPLMIITSSCLKPSTSLISAKNSPLNEISQQKIKILSWSEIIKTVKLLFAVWHGTQDGTRAMDVHDSEPF